MPKLRFQLVTPERTLIDQELTSLSCPTALGQITILPNHIPLVANLVPGELHAKTDAEDFYVFVSGGFVEVQPENHVIVLADTAEHHHEIDEQREQEARERAKKAMAEKTLSNEEYAKVAASLERSLLKINIARRRSHPRAPITGEGVFKE